MYQNNNSSRSSSAFMYLIRNHSEPNAIFQFNLHPFNFIYAYAKNKFVCAEYMCIHKIVVQLQRLLNLCLLISVLNCVYLWSQAHTYA